MKRLCLRQISKRYRRFTELDNVSVEFATGRAHGMIAGQSARPPLALPSPERKVKEPTTRCLIVNGQSRDIEDNGLTTLVSVLRDQLGLKATKIACNRGECGACTLLVGGRPTLSCVTPVALVHEAVDTLEGVADEITDLRESFADTGAFQCGFCTPGQLVHAAALARRAEELVDRDDLAAYVRDQMSGNICRCTGYQAITESICNVIVDRVSKGAAMSTSEDS